MQCQTGWCFFLCSSSTHQPGRQERGIVDFHRVVSSKACFKSVEKALLLTGLGLGQIFPEPHHEVTGRCWLILVILCLSVLVLDPPNLSIPLTWSWYLIQRRVSPYSPCWENGFAEAGSGCFLGPSQTPETAILIPALIFLRALEKIPRMGVVWLHTERELCANTTKEWWGWALEFLRSRTLTLQQFCSSCVTLLFKAFCTPLAISVSSRVTLLPRGGGFGALLLTNHPSFPSLCPARVCSAAATSAPAPAPSS